MAFILPYEALALPPPDPPDILEFPRDSNSAQVHIPSENIIPLRLGPVSEGHDVLQVVQDLSYELRVLFPTRVPWPYGSPMSRGRPSLVFRYFCNELVIPSLRIFYDLRARDSFSQIGLNTLALEDGFLITFTLPQVDYKLNPRYSTYGSYLNSHPPVVVIMRPAMLEGVLSSDTQAMKDLSALLRLYIWHAYPDAPVICSDLQQLLILHPEDDWMQTGEIESEHIVVSNLAAIRIVIPAYLMCPLAGMGYLRTREGTSVLSRCCGPFPDPASRTLEPDETVFATCHHQSDFDLSLIYHSKEYGDQFFRWKDYVSQPANSRTVSPEDILTATTNAFIRKNHVLQPYYSPELMPESTWRHFEQYRRPCPLGGFAEVLGASTSFSLRIIQQVESGPKLYRVYVCQLLSVDNDTLPDATPPLCLKLYDDRPFELCRPEDYEDYDYQSFVTFILLDWRMAEDSLRKELAAYTKLTSMQGSLVPHFYGAHSFRLPDGVELYGILTEYVEAPSLCRDLAQALTENEQTQLIQSIRYAVRVLNYHDISNHEWHGEAILVRRAVDDRSGPQIHCILVDLAACSQSCVPLESHRADDFKATINMLVEDLGLPEDLVARTFGLREVWNAFVPFDEWELQWELEHHLPPDPLLSVLGMTYRYYFLSDDSDDSDAPDAPDGLDDSDGSDTSDTVEC